VTLLTAAPPVTTRPAAVVGALTPSKYHELPTSKRAYVLYIGPVVGEHM